MRWRAPTQLQLMSCSRLPKTRVTPDNGPEVLDRSSGCTARCGNYPIHHHVAEPHRFEHPDKAGHPRATRIGNHQRNLPMR